MIPDKQEELLTRVVKQQQDELTAFCKGDEVTARKIAGAMMILLRALLPFKTAHRKLMIKFLIESDELVNTTVTSTLEEWYGKNT